MKFSILSSVVLLAFVISSSLQQSVKIRGNVLTELAKSETIDILATFKTGTAHALESVHSMEDDPFTYDVNYRQTHIQKLVSTLKHNADETQKTAIQFLTDFRRQSATPYKVQTFWITNQLFIEGADKELITKLSQMDDIESIDVNEIFLLDPPITTVVSDTHFSEYPWGIRNIKVPQAWALNGGNKGEGIIVATIDTGARRTHVALRDNFVGTYGWYDPVGRSAVPFDNEGHGTHVTGTIVGRGRIGVAPNAKWMACNGCPDGLCPYSSLITCAQFVTCPHLTSGPDASPDCSKAPHIVSNGWGGSTRGSTLWNPVIEAWHVARIIPVFSNGNRGRDGCNTARSPGDNARVIGVGSTTEQNELSVFSSLGPSYFGTVKPDISAPGSAILSASNVSDSEYVLKSGTTMACPHVAGVIALMRSAVPHLSYDLTKTYLFDHVDRDLVFNTSRACGGMNDSTFPNHFFGFGKVNALKTMEKLLIDKPYITTTTIRPTTVKNTSNILQSISLLVVLLLLTYSLI